MLKSLFTGVINRISKRKPSRAYPETIQTDQWILQSLGGNRERQQDVSFERRGDFRFQWTYWWSAEWWRAHKRIVECMEGETWIIKRDALKVVFWKRCYNPFSLD